MDPIPNRANDPSYSSVANFQAIVSKYPKWFSKFNDMKPIYFLPEAVIKMLATRTINNSKITFLSAMEVSAETAFSIYCKATNSLGIWNGHPITYSILVPPADPLTIEGGDIPWFKEFHQSASRTSVLDRLAHSREILKGIAGWLMTDQKFLDDLASLKSAYEAIDDGKRPVFPLQRSELVHAANVSEESAKNFHDRFQTFCNRYGLARLATWDLPEPQGPFFTDPMYANSLARPEKGLYLFIPLAYPVTNNDDLLEMIFQQQRELARTSGVDERLASIRSPKIFSHAFYIDFLETTIRSRFVSQPRGLVSVIQDVIPRVTNLKESYVKDLRTEIAARKKGRTNLRILK